ncbi:hypothetical protein [Moraxella lacunata]
MGGGVGVTGVNQITILKFGRVGVNDIRPTVSFLNFFGCIIRIIFNRFT